MFHQIIAASKMKGRKQSNLALLFFAISISFAFGQEEEIKNLFNQYAGVKGFTTVYIAPGMIDLLKTGASDDNEFERTLIGLTDIRIINFHDKGSLFESSEIYANMLESISGTSLQELLFLKENGKTLNYLIKKEGEKIHNLVLLMKTSSEALLINLNGDLLLNDIIVLSKHFNFAGMDELERLEAEN